MSYASMKKAELVALCQEQEQRLAKAAQVYVALRAEIAALKAEPTKLAASRFVDEHEYSDYAEAASNAKRLTKLMGDRFIFTQVKNRVICKARAAH